MSLLRKGSIGLKPSVYRTLHPNLKDGVIVDIITDMVKYLLRPSRLPSLLISKCGGQVGRGLWKNQRFGGFNPFLEWTLFIILALIRE